MINNERLLQTFFDYVKVDSESGNELEMAKLMVKQLTDLGCEVTVDNAGAAINSNGYNIYATVKGDLPMESVLFSAHMDTVTPGVGIDPYVDDNGVIQSRGNTILGGDDKGGIAAIVEALTVIREKKLPHGSFEIVFSIREESGLLGAKNLDYGRIKSKQAVVLDSGGEIGTIITQGPGQIQISAKIIGKSAHAGIAPETGISAIQVAAKAVASMKLLRVDEETTANIGTFTAVGATNIVPALVKLEAETRSRNLEKLKAQSAHMIGCLQKACDDAGATLEHTANISYIGYNIPKEDVLVQRIISATNALGLNSTLVSSGGGSDANIMREHGINAIVISAGMDKVHTTNECLKVSDLQKTAQLVLKLVTA